MTSLRHCFAAAITTALLLISHISVCATSDYDALIAKGVEELNGAVKQSASVTTRDKCQSVISQFQKAANRFYEAEQRDPNNGLAWLLRGQTFNRMGEMIRDFGKGKKPEDKVKGAPAAFCTAFEEVTQGRARRLNADDRLTSVVELSFALLRIGKLLEANRVASGFLASGSGTAILRSTATQVQCESQQKMEQREQEKKKIHICGDAPNPFSVPGQTPPPDCGSTSKPVDVVNASPSSTPENTPQAHYTKSIASGFGYNGNAIPLGKGVSFPPGVSHKDAVFEEAALNLEGDWFFYHQGGSEGLVDKLAATYIGIYDAYDGLSIADTLLQTGGVSYCHCLNEKTCIGLQAKDGWLRSNTENISNTLTFQPSISYAESAELTTQFSYSVIRNDFSMAPKQSLAVLDGFGHQLAMQQTWVHSLSDGEWSPDITITAKYLHQWITTDGIVGDKQRDDPFIKADWCIFKADDSCATLRSVNLAASYEFRRDQYENATFPMLNAVNRFHRRDDTHLVDIALTFKIGYDELLKNRLEAVLEYQSTNDDSNVAAKAFDQPRIIASVKVNF